MATFMEDKFWMVLPYELVRELVELMLWPAAVKEERERNPACCATTLGTGDGTH